tara:strand:+ start:9648 stop:9797 length:150 start_codon:yes stop_codon:yes gene_type:complete
MDNTKTPTIQVTASGKVVVTNANDIVLLDAKGNPVKKEIGSQCVIVAKL